MLKFNQTDRTSVKFDVHDDGGYERQNMDEWKFQMNHSARPLAVYTLGFIIITVVILSWVEEAKITPKVSHLIRGLNFFFNYMPFYPIPSQKYQFTADGTAL